jgi:hypothetical protein
VDLKEQIGSILEHSIVEPDPASPSRSPSVSATTRQTALRWQEWTAKSTLTEGCKR